VTALWPQSGGDRRRRGRLTGEAGCSRRSRWACNTAGGLAIQRRAAFRCRLRSGFQRHTPIPVMSGSLRLLVRRIIYADFLNKKHREGIQHIGVLVEDLDKAIAAYEKLGYHVHQSEPGEMWDSRARGSILYGIRTPLAGLARSWSGILTARDPKSRAASYSPRDPNQKWMRKPNLQVSGRVALARNAPKVVKLVMRDWGSRAGNGSAGS